MDFSKPTEFIFPLLGSKVKIERNQVLVTACLGDVTISQDFSQPIDLSDLIDDLVDNRRDH